MLNKTRGKSITEDLSAVSPWTGLTLACIKILELYGKVFEEDVSKLNKKYVYQVIVLFFSY